jgi:hypothetical protein
MHAMTIVHCIGYYCVEAFTHIIGVAVFVTRAMDTTSWRLLNAIQLPPLTSNQVLCAVLGDNPTSIQSEVPSIWLSSQDSYRVEQNHQRIERSRTAAVYALIQSSRRHGISFT